MTDYASVFFYLSVYTFFAFLLKVAYSTKERWLKNLIFLISVFGPCFMASIRDRVGTDYSAYKGMYYRQKDISLLNYLRTFDLDGDTIGIHLVSEIAGKFDSVKIYFFIIALLTYLPVAYFLISQKTIDIPIFLSSFYYLTNQFTMGMNISKQVIATAFIVLSSKYIFDKYFFKYFLCVVFASFFHFTAVIAFPIYFVCNRQYDPDDINSKILGKKTIIGIVLYSLVCYSTSSIISRIGGRFDGYNDGSASANNRSFFILLLWSVIFLLIFKQMESIDKHNTFFIVLVLIGTIFEATGFYSVYIKRLSGYFTVFMCLIIPQITYVFEEDKYNYRKLVTFGIYVYIVLYFILIFFVLGQSGIIPLNFIGK